MTPQDYIPQDAERMFFSGPVTMETRGEGGEAGVVVRGVGAQFNVLSENLGGFREQIAPGAFDDVMEDDVRALFNHDRNIVLGRTTSKTLRIAQTKKGLEYEYDSPDTQAARDLLVSIGRGDVSQSSFAFFIDEDKWDEPDEEGGIATRTIIKVKRLIDVSPVTYPGYSTTTVALRSLEKWRAEHTETSRGGIAIRRAKLNLIEHHNVTF